MHPEAVLNALRLWPVWDVMFCVGLDAVAFRMYPAFRCCLTPVEEVSFSHLPPCNQRWSFWGM